MCEEGGALHAEKIHSNPENSYRCCQRQEYAFAECVCELLGTLYVRSGHGALLPVAFFLPGALRSIRVIKRRILNVYVSATHTQNATFSIIFG
jgi:hypothetical protein